MNLLTKWSTRLLSLFLLVGLTASLMACAANAPASTISDTAGSEATNVPNLPTDTPESTSTPVPTATLAPTNTPTTIPTETPTATPEPTQTPTATPKPTQTPTATPVDTPEPTLTPEPTSLPQATAVPQPSQPTVAPTAETEAEESFVTLYYISNPSDILGTFPEKPFNADELRSHMVNIQSSLNTMQANLDAAKGGELSETLKVMERRLLRIIVNPAMGLTWLFGLLMLWANPALLQEGWIHVKLTAVLILSAMHGMLSRHRKQFLNDANVHSARYYRILNEVPTLLLVIIVLMVILRPF